MIHGLNGADKRRSGRLCAILRGAHLRVPKTFIRVDDVVELLKLAE
jgi:hypothetical protein